MYQRVNVVTQAHIGNPGPLPACFVGLTDEVLANLPAFLDHDSLDNLGYLDTGFIYVPDPEPTAPPVKREVTRIAFLQRMPAAKRIAIRVAAKTDPVIEDFLDLLGATDLIDLDNADTLMGVGYLQMLNLLTQEEAEELLA